MRLVLDTNILFSFFWKSSTSKGIMNRDDLVLVAPEIALKEIEKYADEIKRKTKISDKEFDQIKKELNEKVRFLPLEYYEEKMLFCFDFIEKLERKEEFLEDIDFLALALKLQCFLWSNDKLLKKQEEVIVLNTAELIEISKANT